MQAQYGFGVGQDHVAVRSKLHAAALVMEQSFAGNIFKSLNLQADRGLRAAESAGGFGDAARIGDRYQRSQHADIKAEKVHGVVPRAQWLGPAATSMHASAVQTRDLPCTKFVHLSAPKALLRQCAGYVQPQRRTSCARIRVPKRAFALLPLSRTSIDIDRV